MVQPTSNIFVEGIGSGQACMLDQEMTNSHEFVGKIG